MGEGKVWGIRKDGARIAFQPYDDYCLSDTYCLDDL